MVRALNDMGPTKVLGQDGFHALFYLKFWNVVGRDVLSFILGFLNGNRCIRCINETFLVLIPKVKAPRKVTEFFPILLCNVVY